MKIDPILKIDEGSVQNKLMIYGSSFLFGMLGALIIMIIAHFIVSPKPTVGTVNITGLVDRFIKTETEKNLPPDILKQEVKVFGQNLEKELKLFSAKNHIVLLPAEAVIAGGQDYTVIIKERLKQK